MLRKKISNSIGTKDVKSLQDDLRKLGFKVRDKSGVFGKTTKNAVARFQKENSIDATGIVDFETIHAIKRAIEAFFIVYKIKGAVISPSRVGVGGLRVEIVDRNVGGYVHLAKSITDENGEYIATFSLNPLRQRDKQKLDLQARVFSNKTLLGASVVRYNASKHETLNILLTEKADTALPSEYETLTRTLKANFRGNLRDLKEKDDRKDITYLANKTGWDARAVALAALADRFSAGTIYGKGAARIEPAFFYALFRSGLSANENSLYRTDGKTVKALWTQSIKQGLIPAKLEKRIPRALRTFQNLSAQYELDGPPLVGLSKLKEMLSPVLGEGSKRQKQFAKIYSKQKNDPPEFWQAIRNKFGKRIEKRLRVDGQLGYLTFNNADLIRKIHEHANAEEQAELTDISSLVTGEYFRTEKWEQLIADGPIPPEIPGDNQEEKRKRYAELLAAQIRLSFPTAVIAQRVKSRETPVTNGLADEVHAFLSKHQEEFQIGVQPIEQYLVRKKLTAPSEMITQIKRIQRIYQITPSDDAMNILLRRGLDSAYAVVRYSRDEFVRTFKDELGSEANALLTYAKSQRVHNAVLNIVTSYLTANMAPAIGIHSSEGFLNPEANGSDSQAANASDVIAYPTLESLLGEMDYCACEHCRSILSPAAYLVDLLTFCDRPANDKENPLTVLLERRPDVQYLPLTCENTNTPLPYIDIVNETMEYFVANSFTLANYEGHSIEANAVREELLASPQNVVEKAYETLSGKPSNVGAPPPLMPPTPQLPFHQPLENLRRFFDAFGIQLQGVMEKLRKNDNLERANISEYGWRDILMEELLLSRAEYDLLTDRNLTIQQIYGFPPTTTDSQVIEKLSNVKAFTRRVGISYEEIIEILKTRFVNPNSALLPKLHRLCVSFATIKKLKDEQDQGQDTSWFDNLMVGIDTKPYGDDIKGWLTDNQNYAKIMSLITVVNPSDEEDVCNFEAFQFQYANPDTNANKLRALDFLRLIRFIRLWKKLGWTVEETAKAITALYPTNQVPNAADDAVNLERLDNGFLILLPRLGVIKSIMDDLKLKPKKDLLPLLACFAPIDTHGVASLYRQMFLCAPPSKQNEAFVDDGYGQFLTDHNKKLLDYSEALRAGFHLTDNELSSIVEALGYDSNTSLNLDNISAIFRRGWLARKLRTSVQELLLLTQFTGIDPFAPPDPPSPPIVLLIKIMGRLRDTAIKPVHALYIIWNQDISGKSTPTNENILSFAHTLRSDLDTIERDFAIADDPDGVIARARMAMVYGSETTDLFFGLLENTFVTNIPYNHNQSKLEQPIIDVVPGRIAYDDFHKQLSFTSVMTATIRDALKAVPGVTADFKSAVEKLYTENQKTVKPFFDSYPELKPLYDAYIASNDPLEKKRSELLASFLPNLKRRRKQQQALQAISAEGKTETEFAVALLEEPAILHAATNIEKPLIGDFTALEKPGLSAQFFFRDTATGSIDLAIDAEANLSYSATGSNKLPQNPIAGNAISGILSGYIEAPENGFYNIRIKVDADATVTLIINDQTIALTQSGNLWSTDSPIEMRTGKLNSISIKVEKVKDTLSFQWQTAGSGWEVIPQRFLYSATLVNHLRAAYVRFMKAASLKKGLKMTTREIAHFAALNHYKIGGQGWMNSLQVTGNPDNATSTELLKVFMAMLDFARIKADLAPKDENLLMAIKNPKAVTQNGDNLLYVLTRWDPSSLNTLLAHFGYSIDDLVHFENFRLIYDSYYLIKKLGVPASALLKTATNEPNATTVREFQAALRARYDKSDWLKVLRPINDEMRELQRDALVAFILHQMGTKQETAHIDTSDKLFEYFLMDVQMEPCMLTSRIRHALSSVQLFIERCLMNLEPRVAPSSIDSRLWQWMKRYRVWEANRKVFMYPENWLEPELRDDMSPFFKEMMSELLQSDITEERAATALLNYLSKLEEVARLEPCGIYHVEADPGTANTIDHVVARTCGASRKYFYRQRTASWTPWEQIKLDIENNPVLPVVWKDRLFLFWLKIIKQTPIEPQEMSTATSVNSGTPVSGLTLKEVKDDAKFSALKNSKISVQVVLCWSEFFNGKWQPTKTSETDRPSKLGDYTSEPFDRSALHLKSHERPDGHLIVSIEDTKNAFNTYFELFNTHSLPVRREDIISQHAIVQGGTISPMIEIFLGQTRSITMSNDTLELKYSATSYDVSGGYQTTGILNRPVLKTKDGIPCRVIEPRHNLREPWNAPFLFENNRHVFYITTTDEYVWVSDWEYYGIMVEPSKPIDKIPQVIMKKAPLKQAGENEFSSKWIESFDAGVVKTAQIKRFVSEDAFINKGIEATGSVLYDGVAIGTSGKLPFSTKAKIGGN